MADSKGGALGAALGVGLLIGGGLIVGTGQILLSSATVLGTNFVAGAFSNTVYASLNGKTPDLLQSCLCGFAQMLNAAALFSTGVIIGSTGFINIPGVKIPFETWLRNTLSMELQKIPAYYPMIAITNLAFQECR